MLRLDSAVEAEFVFWEKDYEYGFPDWSTRVVYNAIFSQSSSMDQKSATL